MRYLTITDLMNLTGKSLSEVLKIMGLPSDKAKNGGSINFIYKSKEEITTLEIFAGKVKTVTIAFIYYNKAYVGSKKFKIKQELIKSGFELENLANELRGKKGNVKVYSSTTSSNAKSYILKLSGVIENK
jgi:hypothetical protein